MIIKITASALRAFAECNYKYAMDYVQRLPDAEREPVTQFAAGEAVHKALAHFIRLGGWTKQSQDDLVALLMRYWDSRPYSDEEASMVAFSHARELVEAFHATPYPPVVEREAGVEAYLRWRRPRHGILAAGRIDRACWLPGGQLEVVDYKTGRSRLSEEELAGDDQAVIYRTIAADNFRSPVPTGIRVTFLYLDGGVPVSVEYEREDLLAHWARIESVVADVRAHLERLKAGVALHEAFPLHPSERCSMCPMRRHCKSLLAVSDINEMLGGAA